jgi:hypothetical protein
MFALLFLVHTEHRVLGQFGSNAGIRSDEQRCEHHYAPWIDKDWPIPDGEFEQTEYDLRLIVFTFRRAKSFIRLIDSLMDASYVNDVVALDICGARGGG